MLSGFYGITHLPLALATSISFARPLFMVVLAVIFLGEVVRVRRWSATAVGFIGVLVMMRPSGAIELATLAALVSTLFVAGAMVVTKMLTTTERPATLIFYTGLFGAAVTVVPALSVWQMPTANQFFFLILMGVVGTLGTNCMIRALANGEATMISPVDYVRIIYATLFGFFIFLEVPDVWTFVGAAIVVGATAYITIRESRGGRPRTTAPTAPAEP